MVVTLRRSPKRGERGKVRLASGNKFLALDKRGYYARGKTNRIVASNGPVDDLTYYSYAKAKERSVRVLRERPLKT